MKVAVVTGANQGIGFEVCRQLKEAGFSVVLTSRNVELGRKAAGDLGVDFFKVDVISNREADNLANYLKAKYGSIDVLVNNAGMIVGRKRSISNIDLETFQDVMNTNFYGALRVTQSLINMIKKGGRVVNVSSVLGQLSTMEGDMPAYRTSKAALNTLTRMFAAEFPDICVNSVSPGWVKTRMGGVGAKLSVEKGAETIVWLCTADKVPSGKFFEDKKEISW